MANPVAYGGAAMAAVQKKSYPDIAPAMLALPPDPGVRPGIGGRQGKRLGDRKARSRRRDHRCR